MENDDSVEKMVDAPSYIGAKETVCEEDVDENIVQTSKNNLTSKETQNIGDLGPGMDCAGETIIGNDVGFSTMQKQSIDESQAANDEIDTALFEIDVGSKDLLETVAGSYNELDYGCFWKGCKWFVTQLNFAAKL